MKNVTKIFAMVLFIFSIAFYQASPIQKRHHHGSHKKIHRGSHKLKYKKVVYYNAPRPHYKKHYYRHAPRKHYVERVYTRPRVVARPMIVVNL